MRTKIILELNHKAAVFIDWANVYGWTKSLKHGIIPEKLFSYLKTYKKIADIRLYFGTDDHPKSRLFLKKVAHSGFKVTTKPVKYILVAEVERQKVYRRKCDFDIEISIDVHKALKQKFGSFIFFSGDGDFAPLYTMLNELHRQVIVVYSAGHLGREIWEIKKGIFKVELKNLIELR